MKTKYLPQASWNFPGGKIEEDEQPRAAAIRETFEETNLLVENLEELGSFGIEIDKNLWSCHVYFTRNFSNEFYNKEPHKCEDIEFMSLIEIIKLENLSIVTKKIIRMLIKS